MFHSLVYILPPVQIKTVVSIRPTATPALGRENYKGLQSIEAAMTTRNATVLARQYIANKGGFRGMYMNNYFYH